MIQLLADNPKLKWAVPKDGGMIWTDNMLIPTGGRADGLDVHELRLRPGRAAQIAAYVNYVPPVKGVKEELVKIDPDLRNNTLIIPDDALLAQLHQYDSALEQRRADHEVAERPRPVSG